MLSKCFTHNDSFFYLAVVDIDTKVSSLRNTYFGTAYVKARKRARKRVNKRTAC